MSRFSTSTRFAANRYLKITANRAVSLTLLVSLSGLAAQLRAQLPKIRPIKTLSFTNCSNCEFVPADQNLFGVEPGVKNSSHAGISTFMAVDSTNLFTQKQEPRSHGTKPGKSYSPSATSGSPGHIFWVIPAFKVNYGNHFQPLSPKEKFREWAQSVYDPAGLGVTAFDAGTLEYSHSDGFCGYGKGIGGYAECYGSLELDSTDSSFIGDFALTVLWHQDPRYFRLGEGSFGKRVWYAFSRLFVTYNDSGHTVFYSSGLAGTAIAAAVSNLYYPSQDVGVGHTMSRVGIDLGDTLIFNLAAEFWPDIDHKIHRIF